MPIYEYQCSNCCQKFEVLQKVGEDGSHLKCPNCGAGDPKKVFSVFCSSDAASKSSTSCPSKGFS